MDQAISRALAYAPYADLLWCETKDPDIDEAERFAAAVHERFPGKALAYNCSPSFNWKETLSDEEIDSFQAKLSQWGYRFQFITLAGFHTLNFSMFELAAAMANAPWPPTRTYRSASSLRRTTATAPRSTSARSAPATSTRSPR
jgi:isocitrate lyase